MNLNTRVIGRLGAITSFLFCLLAGLWILSAVGLGKKDLEAVWSGFGFYFIGKAFFVGPMLWIMSAKPAIREKDALET